MRDNLCATSKYVSRKVWNLLNESSYYGFHMTSKHKVRRGLRWGEETLTDVILLELTQRQPYDFLTTKFLRDLESEEGADWEWWILSKSRVIGLRIQAKRIHNVNGVNKYAYLDYKKNNKYQYEVLTDKARALKAIPLYFFFNYWDMDFQYKNYMNLSFRKLTSCKPQTVRDFGITFTSAHTVGSMMKSKPVKKDLVDLLPVSWPFACLLCFSHSDLATSVAEFLFEFVLEDSVDSHDVYHESLPDVVLQRFKGEFSELMPVYTTLLFDLQSPHKDMDGIRKAIASGE